MLVSVGQVGIISFAILAPESAKATLGIFGAWFDEGRITEMADSTTNWRILGKLDRLCSCTFCVYKRNAATFTDDPYLSKYVCKILNHDDAIIAYKFTCEV